MKVCILSDSHDHIPLLDAAVADARAAGAELVETVRAELQEARGDHR